MVHLALVRHGQSQWNLENRFTGWVDVPLTDEGRDEAQRAGAVLLAENLKFDKVYTSKLQRAQETLTIILQVMEASNLIVEKDSRLNERHYGDLQGLNKDETKKKYGEAQVHLWRRSYDTRPPGIMGESLQDTASRTLPYFKEKIMEDIKQGRNVLVSAHGNSLRAVVMYLDKLSPEEVLKLEIRTGVPIVYAFGDSQTPLGKRILD